MALTFQLTINRWWCGHIISNCTDILYRTFCALVQMKIMSISVALRKEKRQDRVWQNKSWTGNDNRMIGKLGNEPTLFF